MFRKERLSHLLQDQGSELTVLQPDGASAQRGQEEDSLSVGAAVICHAPDSLQPGVEGGSRPQLPQDSGVGCP